MGYFSIIPRRIRITLGLAFVLFAIASAMLSLFGPIITVDGSFLTVPTILTGVLGFFGVWLIIDGAFLASPPEDELDFSDIPYADGTPTQKPEVAELPKQASTTGSIEDRLAARKARLEKAKREGKI